MLQYLYRYMLKKDYILLQFDNTTLTLTAAYRRNKILHCSVTQTMSLKNHEVINNRIINATYINRLINDFIIKNHLYKPALIILLPTSMTITADRFTLLQTALCLSKQHVISHIIQSFLSIPIHENSNHSVNDKRLPWRTINEQPNLLNNLGKPQHILSALYKYIAAITFAGFWIITLTFSYITSKTISKLKQQNAATTKTIPPLQQKVKVVHELEQKIAQTTQQNTILATLKTNCDTFITTLVTLAHHMPNNSSLISIHIGKSRDHQKASLSTNKKQNPRPSITPLYIKGITTHPPAISALTQTLTNLLPHTQLSIAHIKKSKSPDSTTLYNFAIQGTISSTNPLHLEANKKLL